MYDHIATLVAQRFACVGEPDPWNQMIETKKMKGMKE